MGRKVKELIELKDDSQRSDKKSISAVDRVDKLKRTETIYQS